MRQLKLVSGKCLTDVRGQDFIYLSAILCYTTDMNNDYNTHEEDVEISVGDTKSLEKESIFDDAEGQLAVDVHQTANEFIIEAPIAGILPDDLDISITPESVAIKGRRKKEKEIRDEDYLYQECFWGNFSRSVILPQEVDVESSVASLRDGILTIVLPKLERTKSKKIKVSRE